MRRAILLLVLAAGLSVGPAPTAPAAASCAGPYLDLAPRQRIAVGAPVRITGRHFVDDCQDSAGCGTIGCSTSCEEADPAPVPIAGVRLRLVQGGRTWWLGLVDASEAGTVRWTSRVPVGVRGGAARLVADPAEAASVRVSRS